MKEKNRIENILTAVEFILMIYLGVAQLLFAGTIPLKAIILNNIDILPGIFEKFFTGYYALIGDSLIFAIGAAISAFFLLISAVRIIAAVTKNGSVSNRKLVFEKFAGIISYMFVVVMAFLNFTNFYKQGFFATVFFGGLCFLLYLAYASLIAILFVVSSKN